MSLFGIIPLLEIKELASKCEIFITKFLVQEQPAVKPKITDSEVKKVNSQPAVYFEVNNEDIDHS
jgi:hypothetical protein